MAQRVQVPNILVPKPIKGMVFGTRVLKEWVLGPSGYCMITFVVRFESYGTMVLLTRMLVTIGSRAHRALTSQEGKNIEFCSFSQNRVGSFQ